MKELIASIALLFSTPVTTDVSTNLSVERAQIESIQSEMKTYKRQNQLLEINNAMDPAAKYLQIDKNNSKIISLSQKIKEIKKIADLKRKWASEDSLELSKKYPPIELKTESTDDNSMKL